MRGLRPSPQSKESNTERSERSRLARSSRYSSFHTASAESDPYVSARAPERRCAEFQAHAQPTGFLSGCMPLQTRAGLTASAGMAAPVRVDRREPQCGRATETSPRTRDAESWFPEAAVAGAHAGTRDRIAFSHEQAAQRGDLTLGATNHIQRVERASPCPHGRAGAMALAWPASIRRRESESRLRDT